MLRTVFMGTPEFAVPALEAVHKVSNIEAVYTQPDKPVGRGLEMRQPPVKEKALSLGLNVLQPEKLSVPGEFERLKAFSPDVIVVVAYGQILKKEVLNLPQYGCVNIHSSLLPKWRGAAPIQWAILSGDSETGVTTMKLVEKLDAGDILLQKKIPITADDTSGTIHDALAKAGAELIVATLEGLEKGTLNGRPQDEAGVTYASKLNKEMEWIDPNESSQVLDRKIRALNPWPGTSIWVQGQRLKIKKAKPMQDVQGHQGFLFEKAGMLLLGTSNGALEIQVLQPEGKKELTVSSFLNGLRGKGTKLPLKLDVPPHKMGLQ